MQASTSISASAGGSTWQPIVGGAISTSPSIVAAGSGYTVPPLVIIPAPPSPGLQATAHAALTSGSVTSVTVDNQGAGYAGATITFSVLPSPYDPNYGSITNATVTAVTTGAGSLVAAVCTNNGAPQASAPTLTVSGVGSGASATAVMCWTATGASVTAAGATYGTLTPWVTTIGGLSAASPSWTNPRYEVSIMRPRPASMAAAVASGSITSIATVYDGGLFTGTPTTLVLADAAPTVAAVLAVTLGNTYDVVTLQPI